MKLEAFLGLNEFQNTPADYNCLFILYSELLKKIKSTSSHQLTIAIDLMATLLKKAAHQSELSKIILGCIKKLDEIFIDDAQLLEFNRLLNRKLTSIENNSSTSSSEAIEFNYNETVTVSRQTYHASGQEIRRYDNSLTKIFNEHFPTININWISEDSDDVILNNLFTYDLFLVNQSNIITMVSIYNQIFTTLLVHVNCLLTLSSFTEIEKEGYRNIIINNASSFNSKLLTCFYPQMQNNLNDYISDLKMAVLNLIHIKNILITRHFTDKPIDESSSDTNKAFPRAVVEKSPPPWSFSKSPSVRHTSSETDSRASINPYKAVFRPIKQ